jgi:hypothetical protein
MPIPGLNIYEYKIVEDEWLYFISLCQQYCKRLIRGSKKNKNQELAKNKYFPNLCNPAKG